jgi:hypothetical protein
MMTSAITKINSFVYQTGLDYRLSGNSYIPYPGGNVPSNPISKFNDILETFAASQYDLLITSNFDDITVKKNLIPNNKLIVKYIDVGRYFEQFNIPKDSFGKLPDFIGNYEYVNENNAGFSVKFWDDRWFNLISKRIDEIISQGYYGIFLDDVSKVSDWLPNNKLGNPVIDDVEMRMGLLIEKIRNYIDLKSPDKHLLLILNEPINIINKYPAVTKYFDVALQETGLNSSKSVASLENNLKIYNKYSVPFLGFDWFPGTPDIGTLLNNLKSYAKYSNYAFSYNTGFQGPEILRNGPFIQTATDYENAVFGKLTGVNLLSTGKTSFSTLNGGIDAINYFIGSGKNSIAIGGNRNDFFDMHLSSQYEIGYIQIVCSNSTNGVLAAPKLSVKIDGNLIINAEIINSIYGKNSNTINIKIPNGSFENLQLIIEGANAINGNYSCIQVEEIRINGDSIDLSNSTYTNGGLNGIGIPFSYNGSITIPKTTISTALSQKYDYGQINCIGGAGIDTVDYSGISSEGVTWSLNGQGKWSIKSSDFKINDIASEIERLNFANKKIALDLNGNAGTTAKILGAVFGKESLSNKNYVGIGLHFLDAGWTYDNLAGLALDAAGAKSNDQIISTLWKNVFGTTATSADKAPYVKLLDDGMSAGTLAWLAADTSFNTTNINLVGLAQTGIEYIPIT